MHIPVLQKQVIQFLNPKPNENFIDCTIGNAGHSYNILEKILPNGKILGIDWDEKNIQNIKRGLDKNNKNNLILVCDNFINLKEIIEKYNFQPIHGILFDLGFSSWHIDQSGCGFSFQKNEPLDMRYNKNTKLTAEKIVNTWPELEIEKILREYGEEKFARKITKEIINTRSINPIKTTFELVEIIKKATPFWYHHRKIHPATKTFQAIRIAVNNELDNLKIALPLALEILKPGGRIVVISFHSLEDRIVKKFFKENSKKENLKILSKKPITADEEEIQLNPRSRSAKLRAIIKL